MVDINIKNLNKSYDQKILNNLSLDIKKGEFCVILGPSGCGKSTLLEIIAGLEEVDLGNIYFNKKDVTNYLPNKRKVSMIFQDYALYPNMNVFSNVEFSLKVNKMKKDKRIQKVKEALNVVGLSNYYKKYPYELSGGQRQRVAIARSLVTNPEIFLMDEPLSNLDTNLKEELRKEIVNIHKKLKTTTLYVTHDKNEALNMADKIVIINKGNVEQVGSAKDILYSPKNLFVFKFLHTNANIFKKEEFIKNFNFKLAKNTDRVCIKSEDISIEKEGIKILIKDIKLEEDRKIFHLENNIVFKTTTKEDYKVGEYIKIKINYVYQFDKNEILI